jgi:predicted nucleic acid-binding protein
VILDTGVLVRGFRGQLDAAAISDEDDVSLPAVVVAEYLAGVLIDSDPARKAAQRGFLDRILDATPVEDYTVAVAEHHAACWHTSGPRGNHAVRVT